MKKLLSTIILLSIALSFGCSSNFGEPGMVGYIVNVENGRMLVVSSVPEDFSSTGGLDEFYNAISFSNAPEDIQVGQKVQVWFGAVAESYPGQSKAEKVVVIQAEQPEHADLTEPEVIRQAIDDIQKKDTEGFGVVVIKGVNYSANNDSWIVHIKKGEEEFSIEVKDVNED